MAGVGMLTLLGTLIATLSIDQNTLIEHRDQAGCYSVQLCCDKMIFLI